MRISDWSSDVCSSDLRGNAAMGCRIEVGTKRVVLLFGPWAVKIPHPRNRHVGLRANRREIDIWAPSRIQLCPIRFHCFGGLIVVMARARPATETEAAAVLDDPIALRDFLDIGQGAFTPGKPKTSPFG